MRRVMSKIKNTAPTATSEVITQPMVPGLVVISDGSAVGELFGAGSAAFRAVTTAAKMLMLQVCQRVLVAGDTGLVALG